MKKIYILLLSITGVTHITAQQNYCNPARSQPASSYHIDEVNFGSISNKSGKNLTSTYSDFTTLKTEVEVGKSINIDVAVFNENKNTNSPTYYGHLIGWIDFDQSGTFEESERIFFDNKNLGEKLSTLINIPENAKLGETRMRIKYRWNLFGNAVNPCEIVDIGEVEDYTVKFVERLNVKDITNAKNKLTIHPNPTKDVLYISDHKEGNYKVYNISGNVVLQGKNISDKIDVNKLEKGVYILEIENQNAKVSSKFIKN